MAVIDTQSRSGNGSSNFVLLETDVYRMKIAEAMLEENQYADPNPDGSKPIQLVLRWEVTEATAEQETEVEGCAVWQRFNPYYGDVKGGGPSKFKAFVESLREQGLLGAFDPHAFDTDTLVDIEQRVSVEKYIKTQGPNAGQPGNKVVSVLPIKRKAAAKPAAPAPKNKPVAVAEDDELF